jgi:pre-mRNA-splicing factor SYF2
MEPPLPQEATATATATASNDEDPESAESESDHDVPRTKAQALQHRLRKLKQKMNQARQLNRQAVQKEGDRLGSVEGMTNDKQRQIAKDKRRDKETLQARNSKAWQTAADAGVEPKYLLEQATDSVNRATARANKEEMNQYAVHDYHNPQGQHRNYQRNLKSLEQHQPSSVASAAAAATTYNPLQDAVNPEQERQGAQRLADEMHRRIEKTQKREAKKRAKEDAQDNGDVNYINQRNKRFNQKINRTYDKATAEIRQNLERGTAL